MRIILALKYEVWWINTCKAFISASYNNKCSRSKSKGHLNENRRLWEITACGNLYVTHHGQSLESKWGSKYGWKHSQGLSAELITGGLIDNAKEFSSSLEGKANTLKIFKQKSGVIRFLVSEDHSGKCEMKYIMINKIMLNYIPTHYALEHLRKDVKFSPFLPALFLLNSVDCL